MTRPSEEQVRAALAGVADPEGGRDIVAAGLVQGLVVRDGHVAFTLEVPAERGPRAEPLRLAAVAAVERLPGILSVSAVLTAERAKPPSAPAHAHRHAPSQPTAPVRLLPGVRSIVAVASGKGGVGKSTTATNLAVALAATGHRVGLLDADIYGPSVPRMMGLVGQPRSRDGKTMEPFEAFGVRCMSIGVLVPEDTAMIWRGPMVMGALQQLMRDVNWGPLDIMIVDLPPGTGDAQLTMAQQVPLAGAVIVSTPQDIALLDARKGFAMFQKVEVPVLGFVETMSYFACPHCGERTDIFDHGGARREAERLGVEFLGEIPLDLSVRIASDGGRPIVAAEPDGGPARAYRRIAERVAAKLGSAGRAAPRITIA